MNRNCGCGPIQGVGYYGGVGALSNRHELMAAKFKQEQSYGSTLLYVGIGALLIGGGFYWYMSK